MAFLNFDDYNEMVTAEDIRDLLRHNNYLGTVVKTETGTRIKLPSAKLLKRKANAIDIKVETGEESGLRTVIDGQECFCAMPQDGISLLLQMYIDKVCSQLEYPSELLEYYNENGEIISETEFYNLFV